jgi:hypothetical protein
VLVVVVLLVVVLLLVVELLLVVVLLLVVELLLVVVVVARQMSVTMPVPPVVAAGPTQADSTRVAGEPPSGHVPAFVIAAANLPVAFVMQPESTACALTAAFA